eukprot:TRINITY_DN24727_c0_g1_i1.p1 TRINITY_DN24727_c0_g1~~TRINITY_DN24727_c0_g1_i1.p1  ORF type:complete len:335 (+),score=48.19 TRINITY_DN24727_c0_g1_i1:69-1073(+)
MSDVVEGLEQSQLAPSYQTRLFAAVRQRTPWKATKDMECSGPGGVTITCQQAVPVHVPSHGCCLLLYAMLLAAFATYSIVAWCVEDPTTTYSTEPSENFAPVNLNVSVDCGACIAHKKNRRKWIVMYDYTDFEHCGAVGKGSYTDEAFNSAPICRTTDDISDSTGLRVRLENITEELRMDKSVGRPSVTVSAGEFMVTTPLEPWHEKTLLLGFVIRRNVDDCTSSTECELESGVYLASMQYDGKVTWGGAEWGGALLNVRLLRFAQVYTVRRRSFFNVLASIGGASATLIGVLGALRALLELLMLTPRDGKAVKAAAMTAGTTVSIETGSAVQA